MFLGVFHYKIVDLLGPSLLEKNDSSALEANIT